MKIRRLPSDVVSSLRTDVTITCIPQCVTELVLNSIDAGATSIAVRVNLNLFKLQVIDNGCGLSCRDLENIGRRYMTSKCHSVHDLHRNLSHFGFRGEALSSLREVAGTLSIVSRPKESNDTFCKVFIQGQAQQASVSTSHRASHGTTITVGDFLYNRPVRRARVRPALELEEIKLHMESIALINPQISFSLRNDVANEVILQTHKTGDYVKTFSTLFGEDIAKTLVSIHGSHGPFTIQGFIGMEAHSSKNLQFLYINKRLLLKTKLHKLINSIMSRSSIIKSNNGQYVPISKEINHSVFLAFSPPKRDKHAVFVINITCPHAEYDITLDPKKTLIEFVDWDQILSCIESTVRAFIQEQSGEEIPDSSSALSPRIKNRTVMEEVDKLAREDARGVEVSVKMGCVSTKDISRAVHTLPLNRNAVKFAYNEPSESTHNTADFSGNALVLSKSVTMSADTPRTENPYPTPFSVVHRKELKSQDGKGTLFTDEEESLSSVSDQKNLPTQGCKSIFKQPKLLTQDPTASKYTLLLPSNGAYFNENFQSIASELVDNASDLLPTPSVATPINPLARIKEIRKKSILKSLSKFSHDVACEKPQLTKQVPKAKLEKLNEKQTVVRNSEEMDFKHEKVNVSSNETKCVKPPKMVSKAIQTNAPASSAVTSRPLISLLKQEVGGSLCHSSASLKVFPPSPAVSCSEKHPKKWKDTHPTSEWFSNSIVSESTSSGILQKPMVCDLTDSIKNKKSLKCDFISKHDQAHKYYLLDFALEQQQQKKEMLSSEEKQMSNQRKVNESKCHTHLEEERIKLSSENLGIQCSRENNLHNIRANISDHSNLCVNIVEKIKLNEAKPDYANQDCSGNLSTLFTQFSQSSPVLCGSTTPPKRPHLVDYDSSSSSSVILSGSSVLSVSEEQDCCRKRHVTSVCYESPKRMCFADESCITSAVSETEFSEASTVIWPFPNLSSEPYENEIPVQDNCAISHGSCSKLLHSHSITDSNSQSELIDLSSTPAKQSLTHYQNSGLEGNGKNKLSLPCTRLENPFVFCRVEEPNIDYIDRTELNPLELQLENSPDIATLNSDKHINRELWQGKKRNSELSVHVDVSGSSKSISSGAVTVPTSMHHLNENITEIEVKCPEKDVNCDTLSLHHGEETLSHKFGFGEPIVPQGMFCGIRKLQNSSIKKRLSANSDKALFQNNQNSENAAEGFPLLVHHINSVISIPSDPSPVTLPDKPKLKSIVSECLDQGLSELASSNLNKENESQLCDSVVKSDLAGTLTKPTHTFESVGNLDEWAEHLDHSGRIFYIHKRSGMTSYSEPQKNMEQNTFIMKNRYTFIPKGMSPIMQECDKPGKSKVSYLSEQEKQVMLHTIAENGGPDELSTIKWTKFPEVGSESWPLINQLLSQADCTTKPQIASSAEQNVLMPDIKVHNVMCPFTFSKDIFKNLRVIGQLDNKFIVTLISLDSPTEKTDVVVLFDQHAVHERIRMENLTQEYCNPDGKTNWHSSPVEPALPLRLSACEVRVLSSFHDKMERVGLVYKVLDSNTISVERVPTCLLLRENREIQSRGESVLRKHLESLVREQVDALLTTRGAGTGYPSIIRNVISYEACRGAVKFGDALSIGDCRAFLHNLSSCNLPFQCAHGRPSLVPIVDLSKVQKKRVLSAPNLKKLKRLQSVQKL